MTTLYRNEIPKNVKFFWQSPMQSGIKIACDENRVRRRERSNERVSLGVEGLLSGYVTSALRSHIDKMY